jgi:hypothetical protein
MRRETVAQRMHGRVFGDAGSLSSSVVSIFPIFYPLGFLSLLPQNTQ